MSMMGLSFLILLILILPLAGLVWLTVAMATAAHKKLSAIDDGRSESPDSDRAGAIVRIVIAVIAGCGALACLTCLGWAVIRGLG